MPLQVPAGTGSGRGRVEAPPASVDMHDCKGRDARALSISERGLTRATVDRGDHDATWTPNGRSTSLATGKLGVYLTRPMSSGPSSRPRLQGLGRYSQGGGGGGGGSSARSRRVLPRSNTMDLSPFIRFEFDIAAGQRRPFGLSAAT
jgi:hypothetical protein